MTSPSAPKDKFFERVINPYLADVQHPLMHLNGLRVLQHLREVGIDDLLEAWRQGSRQWSSKFSSARRWWSVDLTPIT